MHALLSLHRPAPNGRRWRSAEEVAMTDKAIDQENVVETPDHADLEIHHRLAADASETDATHHINPAAKDIPLNKLKPSPANARKTGTAFGIDELAASIATHGLLQPLVVHAELKGDGAETGSFLVTAGERRRKALLLLAKRKLIKKSEPVACVVRVNGIASELSMVENMIRANMHPADQFEAFEKLHLDHGLGVEEIGARFGVSPTIVKQRLKLAAVSPKLMALYRDGELTLDQLMAFTLTDDHQRQEDTWAHLSWNKGPELIRRTLTENHVSCRDRRVAFVGLAVYEAAGGAVLRDLFIDDHDGWLTDSALLERLVGEKLEAAAAAVRQEGWRWVEVHAEYPHGQVSGFRRIYPETLPMSDESQAKLDALTARYDELAAEHGEDNLPAEVEAELEALDAEIESLNVQTRAYAPDDVAIAGVIVSLSSEGALRIERGFVKKEDEQRQSGSTAKKNGKGNPATTSEPQGPRPLPDALVADLTAHRTAALQESLATRPDMALVAITHALALSIFCSRSFHPETCLGVKVEVPNLRVTAPGIEDSRAGKALAARHENWLAQLPDADALWEWLVSRDGEVHLSLLAYCVAQVVNAVQHPNDHTQALTHADQLAGALGLDMAEWWTPTRESYLGRVSKSRIVEAVREGVSAKDADAIANMKKDAMVEHAERLLEHRGWLPDQLRRNRSSTKSESA